MNISSNAVKLFSDDSHLTSSIEDFEIFEVKYRVSSIAVPDKALLIDFFEHSTHSDTLCINIKIGENEDDLTFFKGAEFDEFREALEVQIRGIEQSDSLEVIFRSEKKVKNNTLNIYSLKDFSEYLNKFSTEELIVFFAEKISLFEYLILSSTEIAQTCYSSSLVFKNDNDTDEVVRTLTTKKRGARLKSIQSSTHAIFLSAHNVIPEDFQFNQNLPAILKSFFDRVNFALIVISLFDITNLFGDELKFRLNGYKGIDGTVNLLTVPIAQILVEYNIIYNWVYESGNLNDKLGLARNILSLHLNPEYDLTYTGEVSNSIFSAYKIYEKQNIKQYIEIRNKLSDQLIDYNKRANAIVEGFASTFQKSALSVLTLFSSVIAIKVLGTSATSSNFSTYSSIFSAVIIVISLIYMFISRSEAFEQKRRYENSYNSFKVRYTDLLNSDDINRILNSDKDFKDDIKYIKKKISNYTTLWIIVLVTITISMSLYFINEKLSEIFQVMENYPNL